MTAPLSPSSGSPFWRFSLRFYRQREVADACITLQEEAGIDVNLLLFLLWHATQKRALSAPEVAELERRVAPWRNMTVVPLRTVRRALKSRRNRGTLSHQDQGSRTRGRAPAAGGAARPRRPIAGKGRGVTRGGRARQHRSLRGDVRYRLPQIRNRNPARGAFGPRAQPGGTTWIRRHTTAD